MNAKPLTRVSLAAIGTVSDAMGGASSWCAAHFVRAPVTSTGIVLMVLAYSLATGNALYGQSGQHPAPLFGGVAETSGLEAVPMPPRAPQRESVATSPAAPVPVAAPTERAPERTAAAPTESTPPDPASASEPVGNEDVARLQQKLLDMGLFDGVVDGYYGPRTADAIRAFEEAFDMPRTGAASPEVLEAVENAPASVPRTEAAAATETQPVAASGPGAPPAPLAPPATAQGTLTPPQPAPSGVDIAALIQGETRQVATAGVPAPSTDGVARIGTPDDLAGPARALDQLARAPEDDGLGEDGPVAEPGMFESLMALANREQAPAATRPASLDTDLIRSVQSGLAQLGFLRGPVTGVAGDETARAIRSFEIFHNFEPSGTVSYALLDRLSAAGATL